MKTISAPTSWNIGCSIWEKKVYKLWKFVTERREVVNDDARTRRPSTVTVDKNVEAKKTIFMQNRRFTIISVNEDVDFFTQSLSMGWLGQEPWRKIRSALKGIR